MKKTAKKILGDIKSAEKENSSEIEDMIEILKKCKPLTDKQVKILCQKAKEVLSKEENVLSVNTPVLICGDIHGQFPDLLELFSLGGNLHDNRYLFLGDYVDRGHYSVETISLLLAYKVKFPDQIFLLRGNHESRMTTRDYGFYDQIKEKYGNHELWNNFMNVFDQLPLSALIQDKFLCMHGGLSPDISTIQQIRQINRFDEVPLEGGMNDLLWSDPSDMKGFNKNNGRGVAHYFGPDVTQKFVHQNNIKCIARAHEVAMKGYELTHGKRVTTIFSAPNYCYRCGNKGAIMELDAQMHGHFFCYNQKDEHVDQENPQNTKKSKKQHSKEKSRPLKDKNVPQFFH